jgi:membrane protease YdiL (CAAX protease family)
MNLRPRLPALTLLEVLSVYSFGSVLGLLLAKVLGFPLSNPMTAITNDPNLNLLPITWNLLQVLFWQYLGWWLTALALHRRDHKPVAEPAAGQHLNPILLGLSVGVLTVLPARLIEMAQHHFALGTMAPWRQALLDGAWDVDFWVLMAVGSFLLIPIIEEVFYRGYVLGRLCRDWATGTALCFSASLFAFSHAQYQQLDAFNALMLLNAMWGGLLYGILRRYSGSLLPAIIGHMLINIPVIPEWGTVQIGVCVVFAFLTRHIWLPAFVWSWQQLRGVAPLRLLLAIVTGAAFATAFHQLSDVVILLGAMVWLVLAIINWVRWYKNRTNRLSAAA